MPKGEQGEQMKLLILSDSHGAVANLRTAVEREKPDRVFHLGDMLSDAQRLSCAFPDLPMDAVAGNCDGWTKSPGTLLLKVGGVNFFLTHGHLYHAKSGVGMVARAGKEAGADVVCFGHTHKALCDRWPDGIWVVNPGSAGGVHAPASYAVAEAADGQVSIRVEYL